MSMLELNFTPFPVLETERLILRRKNENDINELFFLRSDERVMKYIDRERQKSTEETKEFLKNLDKAIDNNESLIWGIALKEDPATLIGSILLWKFQKEHFRAETGYLLHPDHWRKGYISEALHKVLQYGFHTLGLHSIEAVINPENDASAGLLESAGFVREAYYRESFHFRGKFLDTAVYSLLKREYNPR